MPRGKEQAMEIITNDKEIEEQDKARPADTSGETHTFRPINDGSAAEE